MNVRPFVVDDVSAALDVMRASLGEGRVPRTAAFFRWKHIHNPFGMSLGRVAVDDDGVLIALRMMQRWELRRGSEALRAIRAVDTATLPAAQGKGLFRRLTLAALDDARADDVDLVFNTPNEKSGAGYLTMGWVPVGKPGVWLRPALSSTSSLADEPIDPELLLASAPASSALQTSSSSAYWQWRYLDIPGFTYRQVREGSAVAVVRRQQRRSVAELTVAELLHPSTVAGVRDARALLVRLAATSGARMVSLATPPMSSTAAAAIAAGFVWTPLGPRVMTRGLSLQRLAHTPSRLRDWRWSIGDLEIF